MDRRTLTRSLLAATATGITLPGAMRARTPAASPASSGNLRLAEVDGNALALSPDGTMIAGIGDDARVHVWDTESFETLTESEPLDEMRILDEMSVAWSPDSTAIGWSLNAAQLLRDSDIYIFDIDTGQVINLTDEDPMDEDAAKLPLGEHSGPPMDVDLYPSWSADGASLFFARTVWQDASELPTSLWRIPREASEVALLAPNEPFLVNSIHAGTEDGSLLYATWPIDPDSPHHGVFIATRDGEVEGISTGMVSREVPMMQIISVAPAARKASVVSLQNLARLDGDSPIWVELDLDTGLPTPFEEIFPLPQTPVDAAREGLVLFGAPAFLTNADGSLEGYLYVTGDFSREGDEFTLWHHDAALGESEQLGTFGFGDAQPRRGDPIDRIETSANGTAAYFHGGTAWLTSIDR